MFIIQKYGMTTIASAASEGHEQVVDVLLKAGANPDIQDHVCRIISLIPGPLAYATHPSFSMCHTDKLRGPDALLNSHSLVPRLHPRGGIRVW